MRVTKLHWASKQPQQTLSDWDTCEWRHDGIAEQYANDEFVPETVDIIRHVGWTHAIAVSKNMWSPSFLFPTPSNLVNFQESNKMLYENGLLSQCKQNGRILTRALNFLRLGGGSETFCDFDDFYVCDHLLQIIVTSSHVHYRCKRVRAMWEGCVLNVLPIM